ncbi:MAG: PD-(D/E)XK nuclease family protein [Actinobacteria bacterium]|nr:PD-(D/E)XK nuclease family protein [Actinomycetota bacterium]
MTDTTVSAPAAPRSEAAPPRSEAAPPSSEPVGALSPSRAADFKTCPLLYRFRTIDHLPEAPSRVATRGTVVHAVLESLFDLPAAERTLASARAMLHPAWQELLTEHPELAELFAADSDGAPGSGGQVGPSAGFEEWMASAGDLLANYFRLEDPTRFEPAAREERVEFLVDGLLLRGYVDRIDISPTGDVRIVDYKTGSLPREAFEAKALFQMKFYALVLWRTRGIVPRQLRLIYLADCDTLSYQPDATELERFERTLHAIWAAIERANQTRDFRASPSRLCDRCDHKAFCPAWGGTPPPFPEPVAAPSVEASVIDEVP